MLKIIQNTNIQKIISNTNILKMISNANMLKQFQTQNHLHSNGGEFCIHKHLIHFYSGNKQV